MTNPIVIKLFLFVPINTEAGWSDYLTTRLPMLDFLNYAVTATF